MITIQYSTSKRRILILAVFSCIFFLLLVSYTFAQSTTGDYAKSESLMLKIGLGIGGFFTGVGGMLLDLAIVNLVLKMGDIFLNKGLGSVVNSIWTVIRDLLNILFIFSLVYIGLRTIWDSDDSRTKKMLGMLIAAALLINFSLYFAKVVVDVANFTAVQVHQAATSGISGTYGIEDSSVFNFTTDKKSITGAYMQVMNVSSWFSDQVPKSSVFVYAIVAMFFLMFLGFVLAYGAIMLTGRFIAIVFYLMFSPFMFLGWILPQFQTYSTKWWKGFIGYSFYAPIYIFMLYIGLYSLQQIKNGFGTEAKFGSLFTGSGANTVDGMSVFLFFAVGVGFLIGSMKVAGIVSQGGAAIGMGAMDKFAQKVTPRVDKATASWMYRNVGGRIAGGALNVMDRADSGLANIQETNAQRSKWNPRRWAQAGITSVAREAVGGKASRGAVEKVRNYGAGGRGRKQVADDLKEQNERTYKANKKAKLHKKLKTGTDAQKQEAWKQFSIAEIDEMTKSTKGRATLIENSHFLTDAHMKKLENDHPELHQKIKEKQKEHIRESFRTNPQSVFLDTSGQPKKANEIAKLPSYILTDPQVVPYLNPQVLKNILKDTNMNDADLTTIRTNITNAPSTPTVDKMRYYLTRTNEGQLF